MKVDVTGANVTGDDENLGGIQLRKVCLPQIVLDKAIFSWVTDDNEKLTKVRIESTTIYSNTPGVASGTLLELTDYVMSNGNVHNMNKVEFNDAVDHKMFTMTLLFGDQSSTTVTFQPDDD